jgi:hypothetical protein
MPLLASQHRLGYTMSSAKERAETTTNVIRRHRWRHVHGVDPGGWRRLRRVVDAIPTDPIREAGEF